MDELAVEYTGLVASALNASIVDMAGKIVQSHLIQSNQGKNVIMMDTKGLAAGKYSLVLQSGQGKKTLPFIKH